MVTLDSGLLFGPPCSCVDQLLVTTGLLPSMQK